MGQMTFDTYDFVVDGVAAFVDFTPPANCWCVEIITTGVATVGSTTLKITVGGITTSTYPRHYHTVGSDATDTIGFAGVGARNFATGHHHQGLIFGLQVAAPTVYIARPQDVGGPTTAFQLSGGYQTAVTAHTTVRMGSVDGSNMSLGKVYAIYHISPHSVLETVDFGAASSASHAFTSLGGSSRLIMVGPGLTLAANDVIVTHLSADGGSSWDTGASDYTRGSAGRDAASSGIPVSYFYRSDYTGTDQSFFSVMENISLAAPSSTRYGASTSSPNASPRHMASIRQNSVVHNAVRLSTEGGQLMNAGTVYLIGVD